MGLPRRRRHNGIVLLLASLALLLTAAGRATAGDHYPWVARWVQRLDPELKTFKNIMRDGLPAWKAAEGMRAAAVDKGGRSGWMVMAVRGLTGLDPTDARSFLRQEIAVLALSRGGTPVARTVPPAGPGGRPEESAVPGELPAEPLVLVYQTHSQESYLPALSNNGNLNPEQAFSPDPARNVTRVGAELVRELNSRGVGAVHSTVVHDGEGRLVAYDRSLATVRELMARYPSIRVLVDVHRDSARGEETTAQIRGEPAARIMIVLGTDNRLPHPRWRENYTFSLKVVRLMEEQYPGLSRGVYPKSYRFNQHLSPAALLYEVGGVDNTMEEALRSVRALADVLAELARRGEIP